MTSGQGSSSSDNIPNDDRITPWHREYSAYAARSGPPPPSRPAVPHSDSFDRKRRLTATDQGRTYPYAAPGAAGSSSATPIDLTTPPERQRSSSAVTYNTTAAHSPHPRRRESMANNDIVPPPWQPDSDVTKCPVCEQEFSWMFRKHHCRKCGRVVCGDCSPHVITIPSEYIVRAPREARQVQGAEQVRVCKPCVPDPWTPPTAPPPQQTQRQAMPPSLPPPSESNRQSQTGLFRRPSEGSPRRYHHRGLQPSMFPQHSPADNSRFPSHYDFLNTASSSHREPSRLSSGIPQSISRPRGLTAPGRQNPNDEAQQAQPPHPRNPIPPRPRRQVKEEDECPVCGVELAPGQEQREAHIMDCIASRMHKPAAPSIPSPAQPTNLHDPNLPSSSSFPSSHHSRTLSATTSTPPPPPAPPSANTTTRDRANSSYRSRGMINYTATEKDCLDEEGNEQECTICMEEFTQGAEMGRLECWCKFHRACIREWWARKGPGSCPVHVSHEE